jgi:hypothetical protein
LLALGAELTELDKRIGLPITGRLFEFFALNPAI